MADALEQLRSGERLSEEQAERVFAGLLAGEMDEARIEALLGLLSEGGGPSVDELVGAARAIRAVAKTVSGPAGVRLVDTCGTGGAPKMFNISTLSAIVIATAGRGKVAVAKHGNRSRTGRGSAEVLEALGVKIEASAEAQARCLAEIGVCFSFAPAHHAAVRHAAGARKRLGVPTIFNLVGPLANPARATRQVIGTWSVGNAEKIAKAAARLGTERAMVVTGEDGSDELTTVCRNVVFDVEGARVEKGALDCVRLGIGRADAAGLRAESLEQAVEIFREVLEGRPGARADVVALNAGAGLYVGGVARDVGEGVGMARGVIGSGEAREMLEGLVRLSRG